MSETYRASHILLEDLEDAQEIHQLLQSGEEFKSMAKEYSSCESANKGGDLGSFQKGQFVPEFEGAFFKLNPGEFSAPVQTKYGYHIIYRVR